MNGLLFRMKKRCGERLRSRDHLLCHGAHSWTVGTGFSYRSFPCPSSVPCYLYEIMSMSQAYSNFAQRDNIRSAPILSVVEKDTAESICQLLSDRIAGKTVIEIGEGIGLLSLAMAPVAKRVYCIEGNPTWAAAGRRF
jgi:hypothetical protein